MALLDTLDGWTVHVPGHARRGRAVAAAAAAPRPAGLPATRRAAPTTVPIEPDGRLAPVRRGSAGVVVAVGPMLDPVLAATDGLDVTVAYTDTPRPFDADGLRELVWAGRPGGRGGHGRALPGRHLGPRGVAALADVPHRLLSLGVGRADLHRYGTIADHDAAHGLDRPGLRMRDPALDDFFVIVQRPGPGPSVRGASQSGRG